ncbi:MAG: hypothetical protein DYH04_15920 [Nitrospira sp. NTP2]|nr:hypothetical protein [Nitrospira sp. NTP2]
MPGENQDRAQLDNLSRALLRLHKALLDGERVTYERVHGRIPTNGAFFQLVLGDAWFAWLRPLSEEGDGFGRHYYVALQRDPDVGLAHAAVRALLR